MARIDSSPPLLLPPRFHQRVLALTPDKPLIEAGAAVQLRWLQTGHGRSRCLMVSPESGSVRRNFRAMHGNTGSAQDWLAVAFYLAARYESRTILLEAPGRGLSPRDSRWRYEIPQSKLPWFQEACQMVPQSEFPTTPVSALLLHSMAGELGLLAELTHAQTKKGPRFSHLAFANSVTPSLAPFQVPLRWRFSNLWSHQLVAHFGRPFAPLYYDQFIHAYSRAKHVPWIADWVHANDEMFTAGGRKYSLDFAIGLQGDVREAITAVSGGWLYAAAMERAWKEVGGLDKPVLWFLDRKDRCVTPQFQDHAIERLKDHYLTPKARQQFRCLESAHGGHMHQVVAPDAVAKALVAFVDQN